MTDKPAAKSAAPAAPENKPAPDPTLIPRRAVAWALAAVLGGSVVALVIRFYLRTELNATVPISFIEVPLLPLTAIPMTFFFVIWTDKLFNAKIIND
jgi:hypothetical protein